MQIIKRHAHKIVVLLLSTTGLFGINKAKARDFGVKNEIKTGIASWYGIKFHGKKTANGETFNQLLLTCASNVYPLGTWLKVTNTRNNKSVTVKVNDRMNPRMTRVVDLSKGAAIQIGIDKTGVGKVKVQNLGKKYPGV